MYMDISTVYVSYVALSPGGIGDIYKLIQSSCSHSDSFRRGRARRKKLIGVRAPRYKPA